MKIKRRASFFIMCVCILLFNLSMDFKLHEGFDLNIAFTIIFSVLCLVFSIFIPDIILLLKEILFPEEEKDFLEEDERKAGFLKTENIFFITAAFLGLFTIIFSPKMIGYSIDDETHYIRTVSLVSLFDYVKYDSDTKMDADREEILRFFSSDSYDKNFIKSYERELSNLYNKDNAVFTDIFVIDKESVVGYKTLLGIYDIAYIPQAFLIMMAKGLHLPFALVFISGKIAILFTYIFIIYLAIKKLRYGKTLLMVISLIPTTLFLASNYDYDHWVTALLILSYSVFISKLQKRNGVFNKKELILMLLLLFIGAVPKWIYLFLIVPFLFIPYDRFSSDGLMKGYRVFMASLAFVLVIGALIFIRLGGIGDGDLRGPEGISATWQFLYMLKEPTHFLKATISYFISLFSPKMQPSLYTSYEYFGDGKLWFIIPALLVILTFIDRGNDDDIRPVRSGESYGAVRVITLITMLFMGYIICVIFYLIYSPVGAETVYGVQMRYMIPLLFPFFYFIGNDAFKRKVFYGLRTEGLNLISAGIMIFIYLFNYFDLYLFRLI